MKEVLYIAEGTVIGGKRLGRKLGFPTANLPYPANCPLENGVYVASLVLVDCQESYPSAVNIGVHPSFPEGAPTIEAFVLDAELDLYNKPIQIIFHKKIRNELVFEKKEELISQIEADITFTRNYFSSNK